MEELMLAAPKCNCGEYKQPEFVFYATVETTPAYLISWQCHGSENDPHFNATWQFRGNR
jgi:hypothetical protein